MINLDKNGSNLSKENANLIARVLAVFKMAGSHIWFQKGVAKTKIKYFTWQNTSRFLEYFRSVYQDLRPPSFWILRYFIGQRHHKCIQVSKLRLLLQHLAGIRMMLQRQSEQKRKPYCKTLHFILHNGSYFWTIFTLLYRSVFLSHTWHNCCKRNSVWTYSLGML